MRVDATWRRQEVRKLRKRAGLTQAELASRARIGQQMLSGFEIGTRNLSPAAGDRLMNAIWDVLDGKVAKEALGELRQSAPAKKLGMVYENDSAEYTARRNAPPRLTPEAAERIRKNANEAFSQIAAEPAVQQPAYDYSAPLQAAQEEIKKLEEIIEAYRKIEEADQKMLDYLLEIGPGVEAIEKIEKLRADNSKLREWLDAEYVAALQDAKAKELREEVHAQLAPMEKGRQEIAKPEDQLAEKISSKIGGHS